jgi:hypothetical protein
LGSLRPGAATGSSSGRSSGAARRARIAVEHKESGMRFGVFYELQLPKPWDEGSELRMINEAMEQVQLADRIGIDYAWAVEHHFLEEYSHCSASEVFLSALAAKTQRIRVGFGIRHVIPNYNHPARTAEAVPGRGLDRPSVRAREPHRGVRLLDRLGNHVAAGERASRSPT